MDEATALQAIISCNICFEVYRDPRVLTCQHIFCLGCLNDYIKNLPDKNNIDDERKAFSCPNCRKEFIVNRKALANDFPKAFYLNEIIEFYSKTYSKAKPSAPPEEPDIPRLKTRRISHQLTQNNYEDISSALLKNPDQYKDVVQKIIDNTHGKIQSQNRFGPIAQEIRRNSQSPEAGHSTYEILRDQEELLDRMNRQKEYSGLKDNSGVFHHPTGTKKNLYDVQFIDENQTEGKCPRIVISIDGSSSRIFIYANKVELSPFQEKKKQLQKLSLPSSSYIHEIFLELPNTMPFTIIKINNFMYSQCLPDRKVIYFTCHVRSSNDKISGLVVCYQINMDNLFSTDSTKVLSYLCSRLVEASRNDLELQKYDILGGIDIDRDSREVYVASPRNCSIHRLAAMSLADVDSEWSFQKANLRPKYLAFSPDTEKIWASCPDQDKLLIMNKINGKYQESSPKTTINIELTEIICTTDNRIIGLDNSTGQVYWLKTLHSFLFSQVLEQNSYKRSEKILSIKPLEVVTPTEPDGNGSRQALSGGIVCTVNSYSYTLFPKNHLSKPKTFSLGSLFR